MDFCLKVNEILAGQRLDRVVVEECLSCSRGGAVSLIKSGKIKVSNGKKKPGYRVKLHDIIKGPIPEKKKSLPTPEPSELDIIHEDAFVIVINKKAGVVVHPSPGHASNTLVNALLSHCPPIKKVGDDPFRPGIVHRLDKDTSGVMVVAKKQSSFDFLKREFHQRRIKKKYLAILSGNLESDSGEILLPIGRHSVKRKMMSVNSPAGRPAETCWMVKERFVQGGCLVEVDLKTGRTHQIRVHFKAHGNPLVGDRVYGRRWKKKATYPGCRLEKMAERQMLHAWKLVFRHPWSGKLSHFEAPPAKDMKALIAFGQSL